MMLVVFMLAVAAPNPQALVQPRKNYVACLKRFETKALDDKMEATAYSAAVKTACPDEAAAMTKALVDYDVAMGTKRAAAAANAAIDIADYVATSDERFRDSQAPAPPK